MASYTDADLVTIRAAIASGVRAVTYADSRKVEYQNLDQMLAAEKVIAAAVAAGSVAKGSMRHRRTPYYRSGLN